MRTLHATSDETAKTTLKPEVYLNGFVSLLQLELPFPDKKTDIEGRPFNPHLGDIKTRVPVKPVSTRGTLCRPSVRSYSLHES